MPYTDDVVQKCTPETWVVLFTRVTPIHSIKIFKNEIKQDKMGAGWGEGGRERERERGRERAPCTEEVLWESRKAVQILTSRQV